MDDNTRQVLIAIAPVVGGFLTGVAVAYVGFTRTRDLEKHRWDREDRLRSEDLDRARRERWLADTREIAGRVVRFATDCLLSGGVTWQDPEVTSPMPLAELAQAEAELQILMPSLAGPCRALVVATTVVTTLALHDHTAAGALDDPAWVKARSNYDLAVAAFVAAAVAEMRA